MEIRQLAEAPKPALRIDDEHPPVPTRLDQRPGDHDRPNPARTRVDEVEAIGTRGAEGMLHHVRGRGLDPSASDPRIDQAVDVCGRHLRACERFASGVDHERDRALTVVQLIARDRTREAQQIVHLRLELGEPR